MAETSEMIGRSHEALPISFTGWFIRFFTREAFMATPNSVSLLVWLPKPYDQAFYQVANHFAHCGQWH
jgi:hypothetical protein